MIQPTRKPLDLAASPWGRRAVFAALYFSEGAPIGFIWWYLATELAASGVAADRIGFLLALLLVPWTFKFLWAPLVDLGRGRVFGRWWGFRATAASAQLAMGLAVLPVGFLDLRTDFPLVFSLVMLHALAGATQDVAIDAWAIRAVPEGDRGRVTGWMQAGYRTGMWLFGWGLLGVSTLISRPAATALLAAAVWSTAGLLLLCREPAETDRSVAGGRGRWGEFLSSLRAIFRRRATWLGLGIALVAGAGFEAVGGMLGPFLVARGFDKSTVALIGTCSILGLVPGSLLGGWAADKLGRRGTLAAFVVLTAAAVAGLATLDLLSRAPWSRGTLVAAVALLFAMYAGVGLLTAATYALFMDLSDPRLAGTQFSAFTGATNGCEAWATALAGFIAVRAGYGTAFALAAGLSLLALPLLATIRPALASGDPVQSAA